MESTNRKNESTDRKEPHFFHIPFALDLMGRSINQVLEECAVFGPELLTANMLQGTEGFFNDPGLGKQRREYARIFGLPTGDEALESIFNIFDATVDFHCHFELQDYQAFSFVGIHFVNNTAVECIISLGLPVNPERYSSEYEVLKVVARSLERFYRNGRVQQDDQEGRVYTWKKDDNVISFISYPPSGPADTGVRLGIQIRDTQLHPHGSELELWYTEAKKRVANLKF